MQDADLERRKLEAEIAKLSAETNVLRRRIWFSAAEFIKVTGAIVATIAGLYAAITTYRITQLETRLAITEREQAEKDRAAAFSARETARAEFALAAQEKASVERELTTLLAKVQTARDEIAKVTDAEPSRRVDVASLLKVSGNLETASEKAGRSLPFVFIVPADGSQTSVAMKVTSIITNGGVRSGISRPLKDIRNAPTNAEVNFFKPSDRAEAERVVAVLSRAGVKDARAVYANRPDVARFRYYELRLPLKLELP
jgi:hypothetical protein